MTIDQQLILFGLLMGLFSSLLTIVVSGLWNHYLENKRRKQEKLSKYAYLVGQQTATSELAKSPDDSSRGEETGLTKAVAQVQQYVDNDQPDYIRDFFLGYHEVINEYLYSLLDENIALQQEMRDTNKEIGKELIRQGVIKLKDDVLEDALRQAIGKPGIFQAASVGDSSEEE